MQAIAHRPAFGHEFLCLGQAFGLNHEPGDLVFVLVGDQLEQPIGNGIDEPITRCVDRPLGATNTIENLEPPRCIGAVAPGFQLSGEHGEMVPPLSLCTQRIEFGGKRGGRDWEGKALGCHSGVVDL